MACGFDPSTAHQPDVRRAVAVRTSGYCAHTIIFPSGENDGYAEQFAFGETSRALLPSAFITKMCDVFARGHCRTRSTSTVRRPRRIAVVGRIASAAHDASRRRSS